MTASLSLLSLALNETERHTDRERIGGPSLVQCPPMDQFVRDGRLPALCNSTWDLFPWAWGALNKESRTTVSRTAVPRSSYYFPLCGFLSRLWVSITQGLSISPLSSIFKHLPSLMNFPGIECIRPAISPWPRHTNPSWEHNGIQRTKKRSFWSLGKHTPYSSNATGLIRK